MKKEMAEVEQMGKKSSRFSLIVGLIFFILLIVGGYFFYQYYLTDNQVTEEESQQQHKLVLSEDIELSRLSKVANTNGAYWVRECDLNWSEVEPQRDQMDFSVMDEKVKMILDKREAYPIVIIQPFVNWDQQTCHSGEQFMAPEHSKSGGDLMMGKPCSMEEYRDFLIASVERYDGDGIDDMPGLSEPIKYWEIINEPIMQGGGTGGAGEELKFFVGSNDDYLDTLKNSYQAIKAADNSAMILNGGMAGMQQEVKDFWGPILAKGAGEYFDIANNHTISTPDDRDDLYMIEFNRFMKKYGLGDKPVWITEVQFGSLMDEPSSEEKVEIEQQMVKSTVLSFSLGADKLVYIQNWLFWGMDQEEMMDRKPPDDEMEEKEEKKEPVEEEYTYDQLNCSTHKAYLTLIDKLNFFDRIEVIKEDYERVESMEGATTADSQVGQYKFVNGSYETYVLWGEEELPKELKNEGQVKVTDIYGQETIKNAKNIILNESPIYVEPVI